MKINQETINWGIIGCGDVCEVKSGPAFNKVSNSKLVAVMRRDAVKAKDYADRHGVGKFYTDADLLINDPEINAIYIATPPSLHELYTEQSLKAGKPIYVEKPVTVNATSCERMIQLAKSYGGKVSVAHYRRELPIFKEVKSIVEEGLLGNIRLIQFQVLQSNSTKIITRTDDNWRVNPSLSGGGLFHDLSPHQLDIMYWIFGEPKYVHGYSINQSHEYDAPDLTSLEAVFKGDVFFNGIWAFNVSESAAQDTCEIIGDRGKIKFSFFKKSTIELTTSNGTQSMEFDYPENIQQPMIDAVTRFFRGEGPNPCSLEEALVVMKMMDKTK
jgi:predicted dehydrogenase